jgi:uncharacterized metal-binding protein/predicted Fe-Mo cluster-binding NifX family protein
MRYAIPIANNRIAPRPTFAESLLLVVISQNRIKTQQMVDIAGPGVLPLAKTLAENRTDILICGGISRDNKAYLESLDIDIIDNVASTVDEIIEALRKGVLQPGYGLAIDAHNLTSSVTPPGDLSKAASLPDVAASGDSPASPETRRLDCLACEDRVCLRGENCLGTRIHYPKPTKEDMSICEASTDIACEHERTLCRLSELVYFCLEMKYHKIGIAFCIDLLEPTEILVRVLRRFFDVVPVCCKVGGVRLTDPYGAGSQDSQRRGDQHQIACNPVGQAEILNQMNTDLNVLIGICMGADCVLTRYSRSPVTTLFVKDKSLANNPIGAVYSDYYLKEAVSASVSRH